MTDEELRALHARWLEAGDRQATLAPDPGELLAVLDGEEMEEERRLRTLDHALSSSAGVRELELLRVFRDGRAAEEELPAVSRRPLRRWGPMGLAAVLVLAVATTLRWTGSEGEPGVVRSGGAAPVLLAPAAEAELSLPATLIWSSHPGAVEYRVEVLDAAGVPLVEQTLAAPDTTWVLEGLPTAGTLRWWVRAILPTGTPRTSELREIRVR